MGSGWICKASKAKFVRNHLAPGSSTKVPVALPSDITSQHSGLESRSPNIQYHFGSHTGAAIHFQWDLGQGPRVGAALQEPDHTSTPQARSFQAAPKASQQWHGGGKLPRLGESKQGGDTPYKKACPGGPAHCEQHTGPSEVPSNLKTPILNES